jgi:hypothetical protein
MPPPARSRAKRRSLRILLAATDDTLRILQPAMRAQAKLVREAMETAAGPLGACAFVDLDLLIRRAASRSGDGALAEPFCL